MNPSTLTAADFGLTLMSGMDTFELLAPYLADAAAKSVVILSVAVVAVLLLRRRSAAARHLVWTVALAGSLLLPLLSAALPGWYVLPSFGLGPVAQSESPNSETDRARTVEPETQHADRDLATALSEPTAAMRKPIRPQSALGDAQEAPSDSVQTIARTTMNEPTANHDSRILSAKGKEIRVSNAAGAREDRSLTSIARWAVLAWLLGAAGLLGRLVLSWVTLWRIERRAARVSDASLLSLLDQSCRRIGVLRRVTLLADSRHGMPLTWGTLRPRLLLPAAAADWPAERQQVVLLHELAHIKRWDYAAGLVAQFAGALYWFNPLVWWGKRRMTVEREVACDDVVLASGERPSSYAEHLLSIAKYGGKRSTVAAAIAMARPAQISGRICAILDRRRSHAVLAGRLALIAMALTCAICVPLAMLRAAAELGQAESESHQTTLSEVKRERASAKTRVLLFPEGMGVGMLYTRKTRPNGYDIGRQYDDWRHVGEARGEVRVARNEEVRIDVSDAASKDLKWMYSLLPDDVHSLRFEGTSVDDAGLRHVGWLRGLRWLDLPQTRITDNGIAHLAGLEELRQIDLDGFRVVREGYGVGDAGVAVLAQLPKLKRMTLRRSNVTDDGIRHLSGNSVVVALDVGSTKVSDEGLKTIATLQQLEFLTLGTYEEGANVSNEGLSHLRKLTNLRWLRLSGTNVSDEGLKHLAPLRSLEYLDLHETQVTLAGLAHLKSLPNLKTLGLGFNLDDQAARQLGEIESLEEIRPSLRITDEGLFDIAKLKNLKRLTINAPLTDKGIARLAEMDSLRFLWLFGSQITDAGISHLSNLRNLEYLGISSTQFNGDGLIHLEKLSTLAGLNLRFGDVEERPDYIVPSLRHVANLTGLRDLEISGDGLKNEELAYLAPLQHLEDLELDFVVNDAGMRHVGKLKSLKRLTFETEESTVTDSGLAHLSGMDNLEYLRIICLGTDEGLKHLHGLRSLKDVSIASPHVTEAGLAALKDSLPSVQEFNRSTYRRGLLDVTLNTEDLLFRQDRSEHRALRDALENRSAPPLVVDNWLNSGGKSITLEDLRGKVVMLHFWTAWREPSREAMPTLKALYEKYKDDGLEIITVHRTRRAEEMAAYVESEQLPWPVAADVDEQTANAFHVNSRSGPYFIDRNGVVRMADLDEGETEKAVVMLLAEGADGGQRNAKADARRSFIVHGLITDQDNRPLEGVEVVAHCGVGTLRQTGTATTDASGRYALRFGPGMLMQYGEEDVPLGVGIQAATISPRLAGWYEVNLHRQGNLKMAEKPLDEEAKATWGGYNGVVLPREPYRLDFVMAKGATIEGRLVNDFGRPIAGERVSLDGEVLPPSSSVLDQVDTDEDGRFRFEKVPLYRKWWFSLRVHGTRGELTTQPIELDEAQGYSYELVLTSSNGANGTVEASLSLRELGED